MFLYLNYCFICVEMTRLGELLHSMLFVGRWHLLYSIEKTVASYAQMAASLVGQSVMVACEETVGLSNNFLMDNLTKKTLDGPFVDELGTSTGLLLDTW